MQSVFVLLIARYFSRIAEVVLVCLAAFPLGRLHCTACCCGFPLCLLALPALLPWAFAFCGITHNMSAAAGSSSPQHLSPRILLCDTCLQAIVDRAAELNIAVSNPMGRLRKEEHA